MDRRVFIAFMLSLRFIFIAQRAGAASTADSDYIGTYASTPEFNQYLSQLQPGDRVVFKIGDKGFEGTYAGKQMVNGVESETAINVVETPIGDPSNPQASDTTALPDNHSPNGSAINGQSADSTTQHALSAGADTVVYRLIFVSPALEREIGQKEAALRDATSKRTAALEHYQLVVDKGVRAASTELQNLLPKLQRNPALNIPSIAMTSAVRFPTNDRQTRVRQENVYYRLLNSTMTSPIHVTSRSMGFACLNEANKSLSEGERSLGDSFLKFSEKYASFLRNGADLLVGIDPVSGLIRDSYEFVSGRNMFTQARLSPTERALRIVMVGVNAVTLGIAGTVEGGFRVAIKAAASIEITGVSKGAKGARELFAVVDGLPFTEHGMERFTERRILDINSTRETALTPEWIKRTISEGSPWWDRKYSTIAFHSTHENGNWIRVAVDANDERALIHTVFTREEQFNLHETFRGAPRFLPYEQPPPKIVIP
jgi:hypothetical protein